VTITTNPAMLAKVSRCTGTMAIAVTGEDIPVARGIIRKRHCTSGIVYKAVVDVGVDPVTGKRAQRAQAYRARREVGAALAAPLVEAEQGLLVERRAGWWAIWCASGWRPTPSTKEVQPQGRGQKRTVVARPVWFRRTKNE